MLALTSFFPYLLFYSLSFIIHQEDNSVSKDSPQKLNHQFLIVLLFIILENTHNKKSEQNQ